MTVRRKRRLMGEINVVPYIDVMLVLLIIFMVTAPLLTTGVQVDLPDVGGAPLPEDLAQDKPLVLSIDAGGAMYLNFGADQESALDAEQVVKRAAALLIRKPETAVIIKADKRLPYGQVMIGVRLMQDAGAPSVGLETDIQQNLPVEVEGSGGG